MSTASVDLPYFSCILARDSLTGGIGYRDKLPWKLKDDIDEFQRITRENSDCKENIVIMGRKTWESIGKPLVNRINIVVSSVYMMSSVCNPEGIYVAGSLNDALKLAGKLGINRNIFVIGGAQLYSESFLHPQLETIYITSILFYDVKSYDVWFDTPVPSDFYTEYERETKRDNCTMTFTKCNRYEHKRITDEDSYIRLVRQVLSDGEHRDDRTNTGTISVFGPQIEFDLTKGFPLLTTKRVSLRVIFEELIWFLRGQTQNKILNDKKVHIWDGNSSSEYAKQVGLSHYPEGELGPIYGAQWRNFGGEHKFDVERHIADNENKGVDQISDIINQIKRNPTSRRIIVSAWNPKVLKEMMLPPCHLMFQMYIRKSLFLDCKLILRSNDLFLGAPFNIASYALLVHMIAALTGYTPGKLIYSIGDAHIYNNHIDQLKIQISRPVRPFPELSIVNIPLKIEDFEFKDFKVARYNPHPAIHGKMAV